MKKWWLLMLMLMLVLGAVAVIVARFTSSPSLHTEGPTQPQQDTLPPIVGVAPVTKVKPHVPARLETLRKKNTTADSASSSTDLMALLARNPQARLDQVIREQIAKHGPADPRIADVAAVAANECKQDPDPYDSTNPQLPDPVRTWAIKRILDLCINFDYQKYHIDAPSTPDIVAVRHRQGTSAAVQQAFRNIAESQDSLALKQAGTLLFETGDFPFAQVLPGALQQYGLMDLNQVWYFAVDYVLCHERGPCGASSFQVAMFCKKWGCPQGTDLASAYQRDLSPIDYTAVMAFAQWLASHRQPYYW